MPGSNEAVKRWCRRTSKEPELTLLEAYYLYSPSCLEEVFSETGLPINPVLGN
jgi:hypothetical protein